MKLITLTGPSGAGKGYLKDHLKRRWPDNVYELPWYTTRPQRPGEEHRSDRICVGLDKFSTLMTQGVFLVSDLVTDHYYGLPITSVPKGSIALTELRCHLLEDLKYDTVFSIALTATPAFLRRRLLHRGTEQKEEIEARILLATEEMLSIHERREQFSFFREVGVSNECCIVDECSRAISNFITKQD